MSTPPAAAKEPYRKSRRFIDSVSDLESRDRGVHPRPLRYFLLRGFGESTQCVADSSLCDACSSTSNQCARNSLSNSSQRSSGKKILASLNSTRRRVPRSEEHTSELQS